MQPLHFPWQERAGVNWQRLYLGPMVCLLVWLAGCAAPPKPVPPAVPAPVHLPPPVPEPEAPPAKVSLALNPRDYRKDAAAHLYQKFADRIYAGKMPPLLQAVGVLELDIGRRGEVLALRWTRAPYQVPQVMAEIESMVRAAAPFPAPVRMGQISYTEVWLWHKSGRFQLDSLTEGQK